MRSRMASMGIALPQDVVTPGFDAGLVQRFARRAERLGFDGLWTQESVRGPARSLEPLTVLAVAAAVTRRVELGVAVVVSPYRQPIQLARTCASLDQLSGGRLILGLGLGDRHHAPAFSVNPDRAVTRFTEGLELMRRLWREERVTHDGLVGRVEDWPPGLRPLRPGGPPIWFGGRHPDALRRAVRLADGWIGAGGSSPDEFRANVAVVRAALDEARDRRREFGIGKRVFLAVGRRREADRGRLRDWFRERYGDPDRADRAAIASDPAGIVEQVGRLIEVGAGVIVLHPLFDHRRQLETLAAEVVPELRAVPVGAG